MPDLSISHRMMAYTAWADNIMLQNAARLPMTALTAPQDTLFKTISGTFDHVLVVAEVFRAHLEGKNHPHTARYRDQDLDFPDVARRLRGMNAHFVETARRWTTQDLAETIEFTFIGGGRGKMTREDILLHLANHATYHRGFVSTLLYPHKQGGAASDLTVFLRDVWPKIVRETLAKGEDCDRP